MTFEEFNLLNITENDLVCLSPKTFNSLVGKIERCDGRVGLPGVMISCDEDSEICTHEDLSDVKSIELIKKDFWI